VAEVTLRNWRRQKWRMRGAIPSLPNTCSWRI